MPEYHENDRDLYREIAEAIRQSSGNGTGLADIVKAIKDIRIVQGDVVQGVNGEPIDLSDYAKKDELDGFLVPNDLEDFARKEDIPAPPDLSPYLTKAEYVSCQCDGEAVDLSDFAKKTDIPPPPDLSGYAKKEDLPTGLDGQPVDMSAYATLTRLEQLTEWIKGRFATKNQLLGQDENGNVIDPLWRFVQASELLQQIDNLRSQVIDELDKHAPLNHLHNQYALLDHQHSQYARFEDVPAPVDLTGYAKLEDIPAPVDLSGYVTQAEFDLYVGSTASANLPDMSNFVTKADLEEAIALHRLDCQGYVATPPPPPPPPPEPPVFVTGSDLGLVRTPNSYNIPIVATGEGELTYAITAGTKPTGGNLSANGVLSGTVYSNGHGTFVFTVTVTSSNGASASKEFTFTTNPEIAWHQGDAALAEGKLYHDFSVVFPARGSTGAVLSTSYFSPAAVAVGRMENGILMPLVKAVCKLNMTRIAQGWDISITNTGYYGAVATAIVRVYYYA